MAGHSKWANIKRQKSVQDAKKGKLFTKLIREITVAASIGGVEPSSNPRLRAAIDKALSANMTRDTINKAAKRAQGAGEAEALDECRYEGYAPGGIAILVDCLTNNKNRTVGEVRHAFTKFGGNLGTDGSVSYLFKHVGQIIIGPNDNEDKIVEIAIEANADDVVTQDDGSIEIVVNPHDFQALKDRLEQEKLTLEYAEITWLPAIEIELDEVNKEKVQKLVDLLEELDDVQDVYTNAILHVDL